jgi:hypothetical protein
VCLDAVLDKATLGLATVHRLLLVFARLPEAVQDVVGVGCDDQLLGWQAHALRKEASQDIAKVARRHNEADGGRWEESGRFDEVEVGVEEVGDLGKNARPVDGVDGGEAVGFVDLGVGEERLDKVLWLLAPRCARDGVRAYLAVIKCAVDGQVVDIGIHDGGHLRLLDGADLAVREHDEDGHILLPAQAVDGC